MVALKLFLNAKSSLSLRSKWQIGHGKWFLNTNLFLIKQFLIAKFDCIYLIIKYRVSHSKMWKVILLWWGYRFKFLLIQEVLYVSVKSPFLPTQPVLIESMLHAIYGLISEHLLFFNKFRIILNFRGLFQVIKSNKPST